MTVKSCDDIYKFLPQPVGKRILQLTTEPIAWWYGQLVGYIMRPTAELSQHLTDIKTSIGFKNPIVSVHIERNSPDSTSFSLKEYMTYAKDFYTKIELTKGPLKIKRVFLVADDDIVTSLKKMYHDFSFITSEKKYSLSPLRDLVTDIFLLAQSDFMVCTFGSEVRIIHAK